MFRGIIILFIVFISILPGGVVCAASQPESGETAQSETEDAELLQLLKIIEKHTEIATKTKLNADFVPGMVTVLYGEDLAAKGVENVWEALGLVPGMRLYHESNGVRQVLVRGIGDTFGSGNISFLLNGVSANSALFGTPFPLLEIPVSQIERIEVIRGPGSAIHGEFANAGVVNVITRKEGNKIFGHYGKFDTYAGGALFSWADEADDLRLSLNLAGMNTDGADVETGTDSLYGMGLNTISQAPGKANMDRMAGSGFLIAEYKDFTFMAQYTEEGHGDYFGIQDALPPPEDRIVALHQHWMLAARQKIHISSLLRANINLGWQDFETDVDDMYLYPPGFFGFADGMIIGPHYKQNRLHGGVDFNWDGWDKHSLLFAWSCALTRLSDGWVDANFIPSTLAPTSSGETQRFDGEENVVQVGQERLLNSLTLQDEYRLHDTVTLTAGLRYDHYDDVGDAVSPRLAGVWRLTDRHILKAQYVRAFRPPTFLEMYAINQPILTGNADIKPATSDTYELGYIYKRPRITARLTPFYTDLNDLIVGDDGTFANTGGARLVGAELELEWQPNASLKMDANFSFVETKDLDTGEDIYGAANQLANLGIVYSPRSDMTLNAQYQYVGKRNREAGDARDDLAAYQQVNLTGNLFNFWVKGLTLRAGVKNIFDEDVYYLADANTYPADYPQAGRQWWLRFSYNF